MRCYESLRARRDGSLAPTISGKVFRDARVMDAVTQFSESDEPRDFRERVSNQIVDRPSEMIGTRGAYFSTHTVERAAGATTS